MNHYPAPDPKMRTVIVASGLIRHHVSVSAKDDDTAKSRAIEIVQGFGPECKDVTWTATIAKRGRQELESGDVA